MIMPVCVYRYKQHFIVVIEPLPWLPLLHLERPRSLLELKLFVHRARLQCLDDALSAIPLVEVKVEYHYFIFF